MKLAIINNTGARGKEIDLPALFETKVNEHLLYEAVKCYMANQRQGTAKTKTRDEVSGGGKKPWRQKGTGRARSGSNTSPVWKRGGKAHGPVPRSYRTHLNRAARGKALHMALSLRAQENGITVLDALELQTPKTSGMLAVLAAIGAGSEKSLVVVEGANRNISLASRNIPHLAVKQAGDVNVYDVLNCRKLIFTQNSLAKLCEVIAP